MKEKQAFPWCIYAGHLNLVFQYVDELNRRSARTGWRVRRGRPASPARMLTRTRRTAVSPPVRGRRTCSLRTRAVVSFDWWCYRTKGIDGW